MRAGCSRRLGSRRSRSVSELVDEVSGLLDSIATISAKDLARRSALGEEFSLEEAVIPIENTVEFFRSFPKDSLAELPQPVLDQIRQQALNFIGVIQQLRDFSPSKTDNPAVVR